MAERADVDVVVFDILGTMVDEPSGLRAAIREVAPEADGPIVDDLLGTWQAHVEDQQRRIADGSRSYVSTDVIDREAACQVADRAGVTDLAAIERLAGAGRRLTPWDDSLAGLAHLARYLPVLGLSNASRAALLRLNAYAGLRWHQALSAQDAQAYKPSPAVYRLAIDAAGCAPDRILMVAAHAWDLRGAQAVGMRTAFVRRPVGDAPLRSDDFDWQVDRLQDLIDALLPPDVVR